MSSDFPVVPTTVDTSSEEFSRCQGDWKDVISKHEKAVQWCVSQGQEKYIQRHIERGMLLCRPWDMQELTGQAETE